MVHGIHHVEHELKEHEEKAAQTEQGLLQKLARKYDLILQQKSPDSVGSWSGGLLGVCGTSAGMECPTTKGSKQANQNPVSEHRSDEFRCKPIGGQLPAERLVQSAPQEAISYHFGFQRLTKRSVYVHVFYNQP